MVEIRSLNQGYLGFGLTIFHVDTYPSTCIIYYFKAIMLIQYPQYPSAVNVESWNKESLFTTDYFQKFCFASLDTSLDGSHPRIYLWKWIIRSMQWLLLCVMTTLEIFFYKIVSRPWACFENYQVVPRIKASNCSYWFFFINCI